MKAICKLSWAAQDMEYNDFNEIAEKVEIYLIERGLHSSHFRIGNFCINGIPESIALEIKEKFAATHLDSVKKILSTEDVESLKVGDKVKIIFENAWAQLSEDKGTVHSIDENGITVRKYRSKTKGYTLQVGQVGKLELGW